MHLTPFDMSPFSFGARPDPASSADPVRAIAIGEDGAMSDEFDVVDAPDAHRFELRRAGELVGYATYRQRVDALVVPHVETLVEHRGQGYAGRLMAGIVDILRVDGRTIVPLCPFAADYFRDHPHDADVVHRD